jgi:hypothetical protein
VRVGYRPSYVIEPDFLLGALFVGRGARGYYFGDYFDPKYASSFIPWMRYRPVRGVAVPDPVYGYYRLSWARNKYPHWERNLLALYDGRSRGLIPRPPVTLDRQKQAISQLGGKTAEAVSKDVNLSHQANLRVLHHAASSRNFEVTALGSLASGKPGFATVNPLRRPENLERLSGSGLAREKLLFEQQVKRYRAVARARALAEARLAAQAHSRPGPHWHKWELPKGTPREHMLQRHPNVPPAPKAARPVAPRAVKKPPPPPAKKAPANPPAKKKKEK